MFFVLRWVTSDKKYPRLIKYQIKVNDKITRTFKTPPTDLDQIQLLSLSFCDCRSSSIRSSLIKYNFNVLSSSTLHKLIFFNLLLKRKIRFKLWMEGSDNTQALVDRIVKKNNVKSNLIVIQSLNFFPLKIILNRILQS